MASYICNKYSGLKIKGIHYPHGEVIPDGEIYKSFIKWGWIKVVGVSVPEMVKGRRGQYGKRYKSKGPRSEQNP